MGRLFDDVAGEPAPVRAVGDIRVGDYVVRLERSCWLEVGKVYKVTGLHGYVGRGNRTISVNVTNPNCGNRFESRYFRLATEEEVERGQAV